MTLLNTYEEYKKVNIELISFTEKLMVNKFEGYEKSKVINTLNKFLNNFETLKEVSDKIVVEEDNLNNLKDLQYILVSELFLISELIHFYNINELERFRMRAVNYINNNRRNEILK